MSQQLDAIFVTLKLQLQHCTCKQGAIFGAICRRDILQEFQTCLKLDATLAQQKFHRVAATNIACVNGPLCKIFSLFLSCNMADAQNQIGLDDANKGNQMTMFIYFFCLTMFIYFFCLHPLGLTIKLNFNKITLKVVLYIQEQLDYMYIAHATQ